MFLLSLLFARTLAVREPFQVLGDHEPFHVVVLSIPLYGHFLPLKSVVEQLHERGHTVSLVTESEPWCASEASTRWRCVPVRKSGTFPRKIFEGVSLMPSYTDSFQVMFDEMLRHHEVALDDLLSVVGKLKNETALKTVLLVDMGTFVGHSIATKLSLPIVYIFPLITLHWAGGPYTWLPTLGTGFPRDLSFLQRWATYLLRSLVPLIQGTALVGQLNARRARSGIQPIENIAALSGMDSMVLVPTMWSYDIAQPLCPNVVPVGVLRTRHQASSNVDALESELLSFLETCANVGAVYINFGTLAIVAQQLKVHIREAIERAGVCAVWKLSVDDAAALQVSSRRIFSLPYFKDPTALMRHPTIRGFITHCGDTSVGEAIDASLPLLGIPIFADQGDVCQRIQESGVGVYIGHKFRVTAAEISGAVRDVIDNRTRFMSAIVQLKRIAEGLGGASRGAAVVEHLMWELGGDATEYTCPNMRSHYLSARLWALQQWDILVLDMALIATCIYAMWLAAKWCFCSRRRPAHRKRD